MTALLRALKDRVLRTLNTRRLAAEGVREILSPLPAVASVDLVRFDSRGVLVVVIRVARGSDEREASRCAAEALRGRYRVPEILVLASSHQPGATAA